MWSTKHSCSSTKYSSDASVATMRYTCNYIHAWILIIHTILQDVITSLAWLIPISVCTPRVTACHVSYHVCVSNRMYEQGWSIGKPRWSHWQCVWWPRALRSEECRSGCLPERWITAPTIGLPTPTHANTHSYDKYSFHNYIDGFEPWVGFYMYWRTVLVHFESSPARAPHKKLLWPEVGLPNLGANIKLASTCMHCEYLQTHLFWWQ